MQLPLSIILIGLSLILLLIYIVLHWRSYVAVKTFNKEPHVYSKTDDCPSFSVVIITHDSDNMLERVIDLVAAQDYPKFEILIVNNASTDNTNDVIKRASNKYPTLLRHTYLPQNRNGILHMSIATTLGVRASRNEWVVLLKPTSSPKTTNWLSSIAEAIVQGHSLCIGYNDYYGYDNSKWIKKAIKWRRKAQILNFRAISRGKRKPIEVESSNMVFRKQDFFDNGGYGRWLDIKSFHENPYATTFTKSREAIFLTRPEAQVETILPPIEDLWQTDCMLMKKSYRKFSFATKMRRNYYSILTFFYFISFLLLIAGIYFSLMPLPFDNSTDYIDTTSVIINYGPIPILAPVSLLFFFIVSLIHYIYIIYFNRRDINRLYSPLVSNPQDYLEDTYL